MLLKYCTQYVSKSGKLSNGNTGLEKVSFHFDHKHRPGKGQFSFQSQTQAWKRSVFISIPKKSNAKECLNYCTIVLISHASKIMLKILQASIQQNMNWELKYVQDEFRKCRATNDQTANIHWIIEKAREFQKNNYFCFTEYTKAFDYVDHTQQTGKFLKRWEYQTTLPISRETCMWIKK